MTVSINHSKNRRTITPTTEDRLVPLSETVTISGRSRSSILRDVVACRFPAPVKIGVGKKWHWRLSILQDWIDSQSAVGV